MSDETVVTRQRGGADGRGIDLLLDIPLEISVEVGRSRILVRDLLELQEGSLIELDKLAGEPLDLYVNSRLIARGEAVVVNEKFGLRLTDVVSPSERIENLG
jgi:flagellar motor switch protein FliN/FliY